MAFGMGWDPTFVTGPGPITLLSGHGPTSHHLTNSCQESLTLVPCVSGTEVAFVGEKIYRDFVA